MTDKVHSLEVSNAELAANEACLKQNIDMIKQDREKEVAEIQQRYDTEKRDLKALITDKENQLTLKEQVAAESQRALTESRSETDK